MIYRREIDGLRAVAVLPVILFHAGFQTFSGGFIGVDVFFVISGYLITTIILFERDIGTFTLVGFYERRARRILPALFVVMLACLPFAWLWMLPVELKNFSQSLIAVCAFASNLLFWRESGYFGGAAELKPLLHTWSLAVEEQYYMLFPIFLVLVGRLGNRVTVSVVAAVALSSLALAQWGVATHPEATFYLLPTRGWEILIGALTAFYLFFRKSQMMSTRSFREAASAAGLVLVAYSVFAFDDSTPFPSVYTLVPALGVVLLILYAEPDTAIGKWLGSRLLVGVGLISYSAYLWHQPLFAFARIRSLESPSTAMLASLAVLSVVLAATSWRFVERRFRDRERTSRRTIFGLAVVFTAVFATVGLAGTRWNGSRDRARSLSAIQPGKTVQDSRCHTVGRRTAVQIANGDMCQLGIGVTPSFVVIGDSHAGAVFEAVDAIATARQLAGYAVSGGFCAPLGNDFRLVKYSEMDCVETTRAALNKIVSSPAIKDVFLVAEWANYTKGGRDQGGRRGGMPPSLAMDSEGVAKAVSDNTRIFERSLWKTVELLQRSGKRVVVVKSVPEFKSAVIESISRKVFFGASIANVESYAPRISLNDYQQRNAEIEPIFEKLKGVSFVETKDLFCSDRECSSVSRNGEILFSDTNHLTQRGAELVASRLLGLVGR